MQRIGVVGPGPSVKRILEVASEFESEIEFVPFVYEDPREEVKGIIERNGSLVNGWFFSGPIPYMIAKSVLEPDSNMGYCPPTGLNLYKCLLQLFFERELVTKNVSIDMLDTEKVNLLDSLYELGITNEDIHLKTFNEEYDPKAIADFHLQLWRKGKTKAAFTCLHSVYQALQKEEVPVYRIYMTKIEIRNAMSMLVEMVKSSYFKETQIGVEIIELEQFDRIAERATTRYQLQYLELDIRKQLMVFSENIDGSLLEHGNGRYQIFSSRGAIEREIDSLREMVEKLALDLNIPIAVGIGFGETVYSAELNARRAVLNSKENPNRGIVAIQEDGVIIESFGKMRELTYDYRSNNKDLLEKLNKVNISIKTFNKIGALVQRMGWSSFTAQDLATNLSMTPRYAQRILSNLCEVGLAEYHGEEQFSNRGRPRKIFTLIM